MTLQPPHQVQCPACQTALQLPADQLGKQVQCARCNQVFMTAASPVVLASATPAVAHPALGVADDDNPFAIPPGIEDEQPESQSPRRRARDEDQVEPKKGLKLILIASAVLGLFVLVGGGIAIRYALKDPTKPTESASAKGKDTSKPREKGQDKAKSVEPATTPDGKMTEATLGKVMASTTYIRTLLSNGKAASGSGFFAGGPGLVVTNAHVIGDSMKSKEKEKVEGFEVVINSGLPDSRTFPARVLKSDPTLDLALLKIDAPSPPELEVIDSYKLQPTQLVYIFGFPGGESLGTSISVNMSSISSIRRDDVIPWIQVAGGMHPGNSGGPVTDAAGRVIGVSRAVIRGTQINWAIPGDIVYKFFHDAGDLIPGNKK